MPKKRKKPLGGKYKFRRFVLFTLMFALVGAGGWFAYEKISDRFAAIPVQAAVDEPEATPEATSEPEPELDIKSEPEPEPEPEPAGAVLQDWELMLVNGDSPLPENYIPELETLTDMYRVDARIADNVKLMFADAKISGINLIICSAYRSIEKQTENFNSKKNEYIVAGRTEEEAIAVTATIIAKPGESEHHTGLALDIVTSSYQSLDEGFEKTQAFKWLSENAQKYGFILRYPKDKTEVTNIIYEPWHYRYVGVEHAAVIKENGLCLEEYIAMLQGRPIPAQESGTDAATDGATEAETEE